MVLEPCAWSDRCSTTDDLREALRGARMPWTDVLENAALLATVLGIEIVD